MLHIVIVITYFLSFACATRKDTFPDKFYTLTEANKRLVPRADTCELTPNMVWKNEECVDRQHDIIKQCNKNTLTKWDAKIRQCVQDLEGIRAQERKRCEDEGGSFGLSEESCNLPGRLTCRPEKYEIWDGATCVHSAQEKNFYRYCTEGGHVEILKLVDILKQKVNLTDCQGAFDALRGIHNLSIRGQSVRSIKALTGLQNILFLDISDNKLTSIQPVASLPNLKVLNMESNQITSLSPLTRNRKLETLNISNNKVQSLVPLQYLNSINDLIMQGYSERSLQCPNSFESESVTVTAEPYCRS